jgi:hypothetical protein
MVKINIMYYVSIYIYHLHGRDEICIPSLVGKLAEQRQLLRLTSEQKNNIKVVVNELR